MFMLDFAIGVFRLVNVLEELRAEKVSLRFHWLKHDGLADDLAAISSHNFHRCDLPRFLAYIKIGRAVYIGVSLRQVHRALGISGKVREEFIAHRNYLMGLFT